MIGEALAHRLPTPQCFGGTAATLRDRSIVDRNSCILRKFGRSLAEQRLRLVETAQFDQCGAFAGLNQRTIREIAAQRLPAA